MIATYGEIYLLFTIGKMHSMKNETWGKYLAVMFHVIA